MRLVLMSASLACVALLGGCSTMYMDARNPLAIAGGYWDKPGPGKLTTVGVSANGFTSSKEAASLLLRRCGELANKAGKPYFLVFESPLAAVANKPIRDFNVFKLGNKPNPVVYILMQDAASEFSFEAAPNKTAGQ